MRSIFTIANDERWFDQKWLVLGKGPSFELMFSGDYRDYSIFALNHAIDALRRCDIKYDPKKTVAHLIDLEVVTDIPEALLCGACRWVAMPDVPNINMHRSKRDIYFWMRENPIIDALESSQKLATYQREAVDVRYFSVEAAFDILGQCGVKHITTCGIDGGTEHHPTFTDKVLANGRPSFDAQFQRLEEIKRRYGIITEALCTSSQTTKSNPSTPPSLSPTSSSTTS